MRTDYGYFEEDKLGKPYDIQLLGQFYPFARPYKLWFTVSIVLIIVITLMELALPYITKIAIDRYIVPKEVLTTSSAVTSDLKSNRVLTVDLTQSEHQKIVAAYPAIFDINGSVARIAFDDLANLKTHELILLRRNDLRGINLMAIIFLILVAGIFILNFIQIMVMETTGQRIMHDLRMRLFTHIQELSVSFFNRNPVGRLVTRVTNDIQNMHELFTSVIKFVFKDIFLLVGITIVLININLRLALVSFTVIPIVLIISFRFS